MNNVGDKRSYNLWSGKLMSIESLKVVPASTWLADSFAKSRSTLEKGIYIEPVFVEWRAEISWNQGKDLKTPLQSASEKETNSWKWWLTNSWTYKDVVQWKRIAFQIAVAQISDWDGPCEIGKYLSCLRYLLLARPMHSIKHQNLLQLIWGSIGHTPAFSLKILTMNLVWAWSFNHKIVMLHAIKQ